VQVLEDPTPSRGADGDPPEHEGGQGDEAAQANLAPALTRTGHVGAAQDGVADDTGYGVARPLGCAGVEGTSGAGLLMTNYLSFPRNKRTQSLARGVQSCE
jgi:hypothetical protein